MSLQHVIEAARVAVTGRAGNAVHPDQVSGVVTHPDVLKINTPDNNYIHYDMHPNDNLKQVADSASIARPVKPPAPTVRVFTPAPAPAARPRLSCEPAAALRDGLALLEGGRDPSARRPPPPRPRCRSRAGTAKIIGLVAK
jgi:hypothetical protein